MTESALYSAANTPSDDTKSSTVETTSTATTCDMACVERLEQRLLDWIEQVNADKEAREQKEQEEQPLTASEKARIKEEERKQKEKDKNKRRNNKSRLQEFKQLIAGVDTVLDAVAGYSAFQSELNPEIRAILACNQWIFSMTILRSFATLALQDKASQIKDMPADVREEFEGSLDSLDIVFAKISDSMVDVVKTLQNKPSDD